MTTRWTKPKPRRTKSPQVLWARRKRDQLYALLGNKCQKCGSEDAGLFHLHHAPGSKTWGDTREVGFVRSITLYWRDYRAGHLSLLCCHCHYGEHFEK